MMAAQIVTPDNVSAVGKTSEDIINYIVESVKEITDSNEDSESTDSNKDSESTDSNKDSESAKEN